MPYKKIRKSKKYVLIYLIYLVKNYIFFNSMWNLLEFKNLQKKSKFYLLFQCSWLVMFASYFWFV